MFFWGSSCWSDGVWGLQLPVLPEGGGVPAALQLGGGGSIKQVVISVSPATVLCHCLPRPAPRSPPLHRELFSGQQATLSTLQMLLSCLHQRRLLVSREAPCHLPEARPARCRPWLPTMRLICSLQSDHRLSCRQRFNVCEASCLRLFPSELPTRPWEVTTALSFHLSSLPPWFPPCQGL